MSEPSSVFALAPGSRVRVGKAKKVHVVRPGTVYSRRGYYTTFCGYYGSPAHGWMEPTEDEATCVSCLKRSSDV